MSLITELIAIRKPYLESDVEQKDKFASFLDTQINADYDSVKELFKEKVKNNPRYSHLSIKRKYDVDNANIRNMELFFMDSVYVGNYTHTSLKLCPGVHISLSEYPISSAKMAMLNLPVAGVPRSSQHYVEVTYTVNFSKNASTDSSADSIHA
jgi:hypothetical protein